MWIGYSMIWYGVKLIQGPGIGILDVISPSRIGKMDSLATAAKASAQSASIQQAKQANYAEALHSLQPTPIPAQLPAAFTPAMQAGTQSNYAQSLQSMQP